MPARRIIIFEMKTRIVIGVIVVMLIVTAGMSIFAWNSKPQLIEIYPQTEAINVPATSPIQLVFSRAMKHETVSARLKIDPAIEGTFSWDKNILTFTPDQPWPGGQQINLLLETGARAASWLSFPMGRLSWSFKTGEETLAYLWPSYGKADIYALDPETGERHQYTHGMGVLDYSVSSDGMLIYFSASNAREGADLYWINRTELESAPDNLYQAEELLDCGTAQCRSPVVSFDDLYLAYEYILPSPSGDAGSAQIWLLNLATSEAMPIGQETHETVQPSWSPTGLLAYYDRTNSGYEVVNPVTQESVQISNQTGQPGAWSPSGEFYLAPEISYLQAAGGAETGTSHLIRYNIQSKTTEDISGENKVEDVEAGYSPDGKLIGFARKFLDAENWSFGRQIWIMNADGSGSFPITDEADYNHYDLAWSRDGQSLAYVRFNQAKLSDPPELWMVNIDGSNAVQLVIGGYSPLWIP
jgi:Tol biopolymer transport system component